MAEDILNEEFKLKRKSYKELSIKLDELNNEIVCDFLKCVPASYVNDLQVAVDSKGLDVHKSKYKEFCQHFNHGDISQEDIHLFEMTNDIYSNKMPQRNEKMMEFYKKVPLSFIDNLKKIIERYGIEKHKIQFTDFYNKYQSDNLADYDVQLFSHLKTIYEHKMPNINNNNK
ncbi:hypothetical protein HYI07_05265 [Clostridium botulinum]|uniref:Uncharacterized protein n=1 Tax=Clostridium botulinum (strain Okra / Type B1) TaxID=498213 RepID=B1IMR7_CLOBK|nr:hypothetical protein [Clostridium botulinum]EKX79277.1 hypothetical protein CFSAN001628_013943 [Clostridium botulinum CFSAN001628]ACA43488.1 conserved hypothetical protein [Clostridium botulinum B1 str. Okra]AUN01498.1 hypothetical protein RSJ19_00505 [Clostridium botulinum]AUN03387.1 hypothetical protein RSJ19_10835 [Clostridium botulinum]MBD5564608.1 hypothetical protein [Clostridium botulinum]